MLTTAAGASAARGSTSSSACVETHGRKETETLLAGLEVISRRLVEYKGHHLREMDIDAILERRPKLALVDELAHTNAPGCRHPKRYLDVEELLDAGIDVYATLNIQHVESLNDVVAKITGVRVRETVPDFIIDRADEVEVVDLTPEDLAQRLKEGKVYLPQQAERAMGNYFKPGNLTALRELALRRTAQRVDEQMVDYMRAPCHLGPLGSRRTGAGRRQRGSGLSVAGPLYPAPGRSLAGTLDRRSYRDLLGPRGTSTTPRATASPMPCAWPSVWVARPSPFPATARRRGARSPMPGPTTAPTSSSPRHAGPALAELLQGSTTHEIIRQAGEISVHVIAGQAVARLESKMGGGAAAPAETTAPTRGRSGIDFKAYARHPRHGGGGTGRRTDPASAPSAYSSSPSSSSPGCLPAPSLMVSGRPLRGEPGQHLGL